MKPAGMAQVVLCLYDPGHEGEDAVSVNLKRELGPLQVLGVSIAGYPVNSKCPL